MKFQTMSEVFNEKYLLDSFCCWTKCFSFFQRRLSFVQLLKMQLNSSSGLTLNDINDNVQDLAI